MKALDEVYFPDRFREPLLAQHRMRGDASRKQVGGIEEAGALQPWRTQSTKKRAPLSPGSSNKPWMSVSNPGNLLLKSRAN